MFCVAFYSEFNIDAVITTKSHAQFGDREILNQRVDASIHLQSLAVHNRDLPYCVRYHYQRNR